ncbi:protein of unknown function (4846) [Caloramator quimbayensis]|uniref:DUF4846 domain-containing protein n=1 Tax=Caloramator quimbayensis TaxID=1147123 RepID=A0A1T4YAP8_9CLOT|nr:DUF4846 domain-containing protein [Caloramator quimbayensis]SKA98849.1 protein of unknown function (4846) [Caloramator quimbayensis]
MNNKILIILTIIIFLTSCAKLEKRESKSNQIIKKDEEKIEVSLIDYSGKTVKDRIKVPQNFERINVYKGSFGEYLRNLTLKPHGSKVRYYNGFIKLRDDYIAVFDMDVGNKDLQQCADAVIRLRAEYLYNKGEYDKIHFNFTNGFRAEYSKWMNGYRIKVEGNKTYWKKETSYSNDYSSFRKYLNVVFTYAGTLSLSKELQKVNIKDITIGDVFIKGGNPGHCEIVLDVAENKKTGEKIFILAQSYMPAQDIHILKNEANNDNNPWYSINFGEKLVTPEWEFTKDQLMRFKDE